MNHMKFEAFDEDGTMITTTTMKMMMIASLTGNMENVRQLCA